MTGDNSLVKQAVSDIQPHQLNNEAFSRDVQALYTKDKGHPDQLKADMAELNKELVAKQVLHDLQLVGMDKQGNMLYETANHMMGAINKDSKIIDKGSEQDMLARHPFMGSEAPSDRQAASQQQGDAAAGHTAAPAERVRNYDIVKTVEKPDHSKVGLDKQGRAVQIDYPGGDERRLVYDGDSNNIVNVTEKDGSSMRKEGNSWHLYDKDSKREANVEGPQSVSIDDKATLLVRNTALNSTAYATDGSSIDRDGNEVRHVNQPDGKLSRIIYSDDNAVRVKLADGNSYDFDDGKWKHYDKNNTLVTSDTPDSIKVNQQNGDIAIAQGNHTKVYHANGTTT